MFSCFRALFCTLFVKIVFVDISSVREPEPFKIGQLRPKLASRVHNVFGSMFLHVVGKSTKALGPAVLRSFLFIFFTL